MSLEFAFSLLYMQVDGERSLLFCLKGMMLVCFFFLVISSFFLVSTIGRHRSTLNVFKKKSGFVFSLAAEGKLKQEQL